MGEVSVMSYEVPFSAKFEDVTIEIESSSKPGEYYTVTIGSEYEHCTCIGFNYRHRCKHVTQARAETIQVDES